MSTSPTSAESPWPVRQLATSLKDWIDRLGSVWVEGEITQWGGSAGNVYGKLKDLEADATVSFAIWRNVRERLTADFAQGDRVIVNVKPNYWVKGGTLTMQVFDMRHVGVGDLLERIERLRKQLASEGLFEEARKKPLPFLPANIGLVTGKDSDAEKDVLRNAQLRWPNVRFTIAYSAVQGDRAVSELVPAIERLDADPEVDVIIVARGGGDFQNLLPFSDEAVVRAAAACATPLVSAIGHEADRPLLDEVADLRASTPTDAAKRVVPDVGEQLVVIEQARARMLHRIHQIVTNETARLESLVTRPVIARPETLVDHHAEELTRHVARGREVADRVIDRAETQLGHLIGQVRALSPEGTLKRGYAIAQTETGRVVTSIDEVSAGEKLVVRVTDGSIASTINAVLASTRADISPGGSAAGTGSKGKK